MIFSGVDDLGDRLVVDAQIRRDAVQRRSLSVCRQDRRDDRYGLRGRTCIDLRVGRTGLSPSATSIRVHTPTAVSMMITGKTHALLLLLAWAELRHPAHA